jgi:hypothetical protein
VSATGSSGSVVGGQALSGVSNLGAAGNLTNNVSVLLVTDEAIGLVGGLGVHYWSLIDDTQTAGWGLVNDAQTAGWGLVNDAQTANWTLIDS